MKYVPITLEMSVVVATLSWKLFQTLHQNNMNNSKEAKFRLYDDTNEIPGVLTKKRKFVSLIKY